MMKWMIVVEPIPLPILPTLSCGSNSMNGPKEDEIVAPESKVVEYTFVITTGMV